MRIPNSVKVLRQRFDQFDLQLTTNDQLGAFTGLLASSRGSGVYLCSGDDSFDCVGWIIDALDMSGRLIVHRNSDRQIDRLRECYNTDLRVSVHAQELGDFLVDVKRHRFEVIVLGQSMCTRANIDKTAAALSDGGFLILCQLNPETDVIAMDGMEGFVLSELENIGTVVTHRQTNSQPRRRGGRRRRDC